jgi:putative hydrolase of the HAD superfamily
MIQAIVYDAVGTLIHVKPSVAELYVDVGRRFGSRLNADEVRRRFPVAFAHQEQIDQNAGWRTDEERERQRWRDIVARVLDDVTNAGACFENVWNIFRQPEAWTCDADAAVVLAHFRARGLVQAVASNFDGRLRGLVDALPALRGLSPMVISSEVGWRKPAPQFFDHLLELLQMPPANVLFVGDDRTNDFDAARRAGIRAKLFDPAKMHVDAVERIARLNELITLAV